MKKPPARQKDKKKKLTEYGEGEADDDQPLVPQSVLTARRRRRIRIAPATASAAVTSPLPPPPPPIPWTAQQQQRSRDAARDDVEYLYNYEGCFDGATAVAAAPAAANSSLPGLVYENRQGTQWKFDRIIGAGISTLFLHLLLFGGHGQS